jgi:hypothetical protein
MTHFQDFPVSTNMISNVFMLYHMKVQMVYDLGEKKYQNPKFIFLTISGQKVIKTDYSAEA